MASFTVETRNLDATLKHLAAGVKSLPSGRGNPLVAWRQAYGERTRRAPRPTVGATGQFRGNTWPALEPQYTRKTDGVVVPVWGGVPRAVISDGRFGINGPHSRLGVVTRATGTGIRKGLTKRQRAAGFGVVKAGQVIGTGANVLGKLRNNGWRYRQSDKQLDPTGPNNLLGDFSRSAPKMEENNKRAIVTTSKPYAAKVHRRRPFAWGTEIARVEMESLTSYCVAYLRGLLRRS